MRKLIRALRGVGLGVAIVLLSHVCHAAPALTDSYQNLQTAVMPAGTNAAPTAPGKYSYPNFQRMPMPPETNERQCDVYSRAANQMVEMRRDGITYAVAFEDVNRIDVWNEKVVMIAMLGAAYSKEGRTAWRDPRSAEWSVMRKCTAWLYNNNQRETM